MPSQFLTNTNKRAYGGGQTPSTSPSAYSSDSSSRASVSISKSPVTTIAAGSSASSVRSGQENGQVTMLLPSDTSATSTNKKTKVPEGPYRNVDAGVYQDLVTLCRPLYFPSPSPTPLQIPPLLEDALEISSEKQGTGNEVATSVNQSNKRRKADPSSIPCTATSSVTSHSQNQGNIQKNQEL